VERDYLIKQIHDQRKGFAYRFNLLKTLIKLDKGRAQEIINNFNKAHNKRQIS